MIPNTIRPLMWKRRLRSETFPLGELPHCLTVSPLWTRKTRLAPRLRRSRLLTYHCFRLCLRSAHLRRLPTDTRTTRRRTVPRGIIRSIISRLVELHCQSHRCPTRTIVGPLRVRMTKVRNRARLLTVPARGKVQVAERRKVTRRRRQNRSRLASHCPSTCQIAKGARLYALGIGEYPDASLSWRPQLMLCKK